MLCNRASRRALSQFPRKSSIHSHIAKSSFTTIILSRSTPCHQPPRRLPIHPHRRLTTHQTLTERFRAMMDDARRSYPIALPVLFVTCFFSLSLLALMSYDEYTRVEPRFAAYPPTVEQQLRLGIYHTEIRPGPEIAVEAFNRALQEAERFEMDLYSVEYMGIRIRFAAALEKFGRAKGAVEVLRGLVKDCEEKVRVLDRARTLRQKRLARGEDVEVPRPEEDTGLRKRLLRKVIECNVKIAELYSSDYIQDANSARKLLSDTVGLLFSESNDPQKNGFSTDNGAGLNMDEIAAMLDRLGSLFMACGDQASALQLYMLALDSLRKACNGKATCNEVQLLATIGTTMARAAGHPGALINGKPANTESISKARAAAVTWHKQAQDVAAQVDPIERDSTCDLGVLASSVNMADLLFENGQIAQSRALYNQIFPVLKRKDLHPLLEIAELGMKKLT